VAIEVDVIDVGFVVGVRDKGCSHEAMEVKASGMWTIEKGYA